MKLLIVVDMQNDFIDGALGTPESQGIVDEVASLIRSFEGKIIYTMDTHQENYLETMEGKKLPVRHCIKGSHGWQISDKIPCNEDAIIIEKPTFGSLELGSVLHSLALEESLEEIILVGLCTDICVISNAMIAKATLPEVAIKVVANCCAGVTPVSHINALEAMKMCHIEVI